MDIYKQRATRKGGIKQKKKKKKKIKFYWIYHFSARFDVNPCIEKSSMQEFLLGAKFLSGILFISCCSVHCTGLVHH